MFGLRVLTTGDSFFTGPASRNPERKSSEHARASRWLGTPAIPTPGVVVGFEDSLGGGDRDFNDYRFVVSNVSVEDASPVPEPGTLLTFGTGMAALFAVVTAPELNSEDVKLNAEPRAVGQSGMVFCLPMAEEMSAMGKRLSFFGGTATCLLRPLPSGRLLGQPFVLTFDVTVTFTLGPLQEIFGHAPQSRRRHARKGDLRSHAARPQHDPQTSVFSMGAVTYCASNHGTGLTLPVETYQSFDNANCASGVCDGFLALATSGAVPGFDLVQAAVAFETAAGREGESLPRVQPSLPRASEPVSFASTRSCQTRAQMTSRTQSAARCNCATCPPCRCPSQGR